MSTSNEFARGAAHAAGSTLADAVLKTSQGQMAVAYSASEIAAGSAALAGSAVAAGHAVAGVGTAAVAAGTVFAVAAAPIVVAGVIGVGVIAAVDQFCKWLKD